MKYRHIYDPVALEEYKEALEWYMERSIMAANNFAFEITEKITTICEDPTRFRNVYHVFRETALKKYPYTIVYFADDKKRKIIITSIFHNKRHPAKKYRK